MKTRLLFYTCGVSKKNFFFILVTIKKSKCCCCCNNMIAQQTSKCLHESRINQGSYPIEYTIMRIRIKKWKSNLKDEVKSQNENWGTQQTQRPKPTHIKDVTLGQLSRKYHFTEFHPQNFFFFQKWKIFFQKYIFFSSIKVRVHFTWELTNTQMRNLFFPFFFPQSCYVLVKKRKKEKKNFFPHRKKRRNFMINFWAKCFFTQVSTLILESLVIFLQENCVKKCHFVIWDWYGWKYISPMGRLQIWFSGLLGISLWELMLLDMVPGIISNRIYIVRIEKMRIKSQK